MHSAMMEAPVSGLSQPCTAGVETWAPPAGPATSRSDVGNVMFDPSKLILRIPENMQVLKSGQTIHISTVAGV